MAVYLGGEEASEKGRMSKWLRCRGYNYPYLNSVIVLVEAATRHVTSGLRPRRKPYQIPKAIKAV